MRSYTTLGEGKSTKVLEVPSYGTAVTVTSCPADRARQVAAALVGTDRCLPVELYPVAVACDGAPVQARRHLLAFYDSVADGKDPGSGGPAWERAEAVVARLGRAVTGLPAAVIAAVRAQLAEHLAGFDGVLVPARISTVGRRRMCLDVVVSAGTGWEQDRWWDDVLASGDLSAEQDDPGLPCGGPLVVCGELSELPNDLYHTEPAGTGFADWSMKNLMEEAGDGSGLQVGVRTSHLIAWVAHHRPADTATVTRLLAEN
jgi:hypothetical protein